jgi:hypothetical protein
MRDPHEEDMVHPRAPRAVLAASGLKPHSGAAIKVAATVRQLADVAELTKLFGDAVLPLGLDVTDREQVRKVIGQALGSFRLCCPCCGNRAAGTSSASQVAWGLWRCRSSASIAPPNGQSKRSSIKRGLTWSRSTLLHQRGSALADLLELHFKTTKLLRA